MILKWLHPIFTFLWVYLPFDRNWPFNWTNFNSLHQRMIWLIIYCFMSRSRIFHLYGDITITSERLQKFRPMLMVLRALEQGGSLSYHTCYDMGPRFFRSHLKDHPTELPLTTHKEMWKICSNPDHHGSPFSPLLRHKRCGGPIETWILTG
jgi:hypothetical protein